MYRILSVSHDPQVSVWQQSLLERGGYAVVRATNAQEATPLIRAESIDALLLGSAVGVLDRTLLALLGVDGGVPVVCTCGLSSDRGCPVVHVPPGDPSQVLEAFADVLGNDRVTRGIRGTHEIFSSP